MSGASSGHARGWLSARIAALPRAERWAGRLGPWLDRARDVLAFAVRRARAARLAQVAGSLTFTTTLSIVPLAAVALSVFAAFPLFDEYRISLEKLLLRELLPPQISATILRYVHDFTANAAGLTAAGLVFLVIAALLMIHTVDRVLNDIWQVQARRSVLGRILVYWALLTVGPLAVGASLSATSYVFALSGGTPSRPAGLVRTVLDLAPFVIGGFVLTALYLLVPNRKVELPDALVGGFVASALGELLSFGFGLYIRTGTLAGIYGAFSAVPLFLLWVYLSWCVLLFGAAIAATLPVLRSTRFADERRAGNRFLSALALLRELLQARRQGADDGRVATAALARAVRFDLYGVERMLGELERLGYVSRLDGAHAGKWLLTCDPERTSLLPLFSLLAVDPENSLLGDRPELRNWLDSGLRADWLQQPLAVALVASGGQPLPR